MQAESAYISVQGLGLKSALGRIYEGVDLTVQKGQVCALFGSEGSGKTSLLLTLGGRMKYQVGTGTVAGFDLKKQYKKVRALSALTVIERINDVPEFLSVHDLVAAELQMAGKSGRKDAVTAYLQQWDFLEFEHVAYRDLDSNERSLLGIMLACVDDPELLLVDDIQQGVTQHRSITWVNMFKQMAKEKGMTIVFATMEYEIAMHADCVVVVSQKAEDQRKAVIAELGPGTVIPVVGSGNGVVVTEV